VEVKSQYYKGSVGSLHLNNKEAKRELKVKHNNETLPFCSEPRYLGGMFDRSLTYHRHLKTLRKKLTSSSCIAILRQLTGSSWGAGATTLQTATLPWFMQQHITALLSGAGMLTPNGIRRKFSWGGFIHLHMVVICVWCALFVTSQFDIIFMF